MASLLRPGARHLAAGHSRMRVERVAGLGGDKGLKGRVSQRLLLGNTGGLGVLLFVTSHLYYYMVSCMFSISILK